MAFRDNQDSPREMIQGNWKCSECGVEITEMPFEPSPDRPIFCKECWSKQRDARKPRGDFSPRKMIQGNWKCSECGAKITELPFEPSEGNPIYCRECWSKKRAEKF